MRTLSLLCILPVLAFAKDFPVADVAAFDEAVKAAKPGDVILLAEGGMEGRGARSSFCRRQC